MIRIIQFILFLIPWFFSGVFMSDASFYQTLNLPFFAPPGFLFGIVWPILYLLIAYSIYRIHQQYSFKSIPSYTKTLISNYVFNQLFTFVFFGLHNLFLSFVVAVACFLTSLFLYYETKELDEKASRFLLPYVFWTLFASILSMTIYFMNL